MAISSDSYGSASDVAAQVGRYTDSGRFTVDTRPALSQVERDIDRVSAILNTLLAGAGFDTPLTATTPKLVMDAFVISQVVQLAHGANGAGPFAPGSEELRDGKTPWGIILNDAAKFIKEYAAGLGALGATTNTQGISGLACRTTDNSGDDIIPMFQRKQLKNLIIDWDTE